MFRLLYSPFKVFILSSVFLVLSLSLDGGLARLLQLKQDEQALQKQLVQLDQLNAELQKQIVQAQDPAFIERQAMDLYDLAGDQDLVFVFTER
jgi:cell division protein FtsB